MLILIIITPLQGGVFFLAISIIKWKNKKQDVTSRPSIEVEYHAMALSIC